MVPLDGVDGVAGRGGVGEDAGVAGPHRVAAARREQRRRRIHEPHRIRGPCWAGDGGDWRIPLGFQLACGFGVVGRVGAAAAAAEEEEEEI